MDGIGGLLMSQRLSQQPGQVCTGNSSNYQIQRPVRRIIPIITIHKHRISHTLYADMAQTTTLSPKILSITMMMWNYVAR